jgi:antitoxin (DNA-binding transcriptional repressor) of toxin-antitoxin stability system
VIAALRSLGAACLSFQDYGRLIMDKHVSKSEFQARALELMREVEELGHTIVVTDGGKPVVEIRAVPKPERDPREFLRGSVLYYERPFDPVGEDDWEALAEPDGP